MSFDTIFVTAAVSAAAFFFVRSLYRTATGKTQSCGCSGCDGCNKSDCSDIPPENRIH